MPRLLAEIQLKMATEANASGFSAQSQGLK